MENIIIKTDLIPSQFDDYIIKTQDGILLQDVKNFISNNLSDKFISIELFYNSFTDKIHINSKELISENLFREFVEGIEKSKYHYLFNFEI